MPNALCTHNTLCMSNATPSTDPHTIAQAAVARSLATGGLSTLLPGTPEMAQAMRNELYGRCAEAKHAGSEDGVTDESFYTGTSADGRSWQVAVIG